jgi:hypothetical protein
MDRRRATIGLALFCALSISALGAQSASAAFSKAVNTTAYTCVPGGGNKDFSDAHCDNKVTPGTGSFGHEVIPVNQETAVITTNEKTKNLTTESTPAILKGEVALTKTEIECGSVHGEGTFKNEEPSAKVHTGSGTGETKMTSCTVRKPAKCVVAEPIVVKVQGIPVEKGGAGGNEMGGEIKPAVGSRFVEIEFKDKGGESCPLKNKVFPIEGSAIATGSPEPTAVNTGATAIYTNEMTKETLTMGGKPAEFSVATTVRMSPVLGVEQNPISGTTVT